MYFSKSGFPVGFVVRDFPGLCSFKLSNPFCYNCDNLKSTIFSPFQLLINMVRYFMKPFNLFLKAIGQHEFDFGVEGLASFLSNITFPALASNIDTVNEPSIDGLLPKQHIVTFANGERVGIVGYIYKETPDDVNTGSYRISHKI